MSGAVKAERIREVNLSEALSERYLSYAMSTIVSRSLPDVRDGLKPVHRRLLYAMRLLKLEPTLGFKKCARVVGDVIGKYHPHGDAAVYDAMVRLAQDFAVRYPLVEGQGNFGNIDGDNAAAMRYTESRLTEIAWTMMEGLNEDAVDFRETYDGSESEPIVMPSAFPNLLANGSSGIAVGMATNIPPHNAGEVCDALLHLIKKPESTVAELVKFVPGPDFPTGGTLIEEKADIVAAYEKGKGAFRVRAKWEIEELPRGAYQIVITEIPYQVQKAKLVERIAELLLSKKLPLLSDVRDESAEEIRVVLEPRSRTVEAEHIMEHLFKQTDLESRFNMNMNVLDAKGVPMVMDLAQVLKAFLAHRQDVLVRRSNFRLNKIEHRLEVLAGYLVAYLNIDEVIRIIREEDDPKAVMIKKFKLTDTQVEAILNMRLRALRKLEEVEIQKEHDALSEERNSLSALLADEAQQWDNIAQQITETRTKFGKRTKLGKRRTELGGAPTDIEVPIEAMVEKEPITVIMSQMGWLRAMKGHVDLDGSFNFKEGDEGKYIFHAQTTDKILIFGASGRFFTVDANDIPSGRGYGQPLRLLVDLPSGSEVVDMFVYKSGEKLLVASSQGRGFVVEEDNVVAQTRSGKIILNPAKDDKAAFCHRVKGNHAATIGINRKLLVYPLDEIPVMNRGRGVILQRYKGGGLSDVTTFNIEEGLRYPSGNGYRTETELMPWLGKRAQVGRFPPVGFPRSNKFTK